MKSLRSSFALLTAATALTFVSIGCSGDPSPSTGTTREASSRPAASVQRGPRVEIAHAESSIALRDLPQADEREEREHPVLRVKKSWPTPQEPGRELQSALPKLSMPVTLQNFEGQGNDVSSATVTGTPPDTNGAVGPNHYVQTVNGGIMVWTKTGTVAAASKAVNMLWTGYTGTNLGNKCATNNDGDPVVLYDQLADRWFVTQFSLPNSNKNAGPSFQCVAVSKTGDPAGEYWLYDFKYASAVNDYGKFAVWPDAYLATFNQFPAGNGYLGADVCAYDRAKMLAGQTATQQCFQQSAATTYSILPANADGSVPPPRGTPAFFMQLGEDAKGNFDNTLQYWTLSLDWATPANTKITGPASLAVTAYTGLCDQTGTCIPQGPAGNGQLDSLGDRLMFRLAYRNFGTYESIVANHSIVAGSTGGVRWYEIRDPFGSPTIAQQGTYAPNDSKYRWMGSLAQDQAGDIALGFSVSSSTATPAVAWTGHLNGDAAGTMGQGESVLVSGSGHENGASRWGDYSSMWIDPNDDCTFWYTQELYNTTGQATWDTQISSAKFANCAANDFTLSLAPATNNVAPGGQATYTVTTASAVGSAETIALVVQSLPAGVTGSFNPASVSAGSTSTLTLSAAAGAAASTTTFTVVGKATSAVHAATAQVVVGGGCTPLATCPAPDNCGTISDGCGGMISCGTCTGSDTCGGGGMANVCGCAPIAMCPNGENCGTEPNGCGGMLTCGTCSGTDTCVANHCTPAGTDAGGGTDSGVADNDAGTGADSGAPRDAGTPRDAGKKDSGLAAADASDDAGDGNGDTGGTNSGCSCRTASSPSEGAPLPLLGFGGLGLVFAVRLRRRRAGADRAKDLAG